MRIMGIDYGDSRIGVAVSDPLGFTAQGIETVTWNGSLKKPIKRICTIIDEYGVEKIVVGFPRNMNGTIGPRGEKTQEFITELTASSGLDIVKWDERLTTIAANRTMHEVGMKTSKKKKVVDIIAAVLILQGYLDNMGNMKK